MTGAPFRPALLSRVRCPADRGDSAYVGRVMQEGGAVHHNHLGSPFVWVTVQHPRGHKTVWPSNRLQAN